ncbi:ankyrin [Anaeromyces robustus]|uniref:Ankyrin n=1 Tax=Anaeromyces robustus TaxID=1754192 RepID=A0A1Y1WUV8_9FUNG|nr:ankyrin [Anaeromyces robustus]|eukprot:ORX77330.1 ankyrin [Anaeromyces robustus]
MDYFTFETEFFSMLQNNNEKCLIFIDNNKDLINNFLGFNSKTETIESFINKINESLLYPNNNNLLPHTNYFELIEKVLNHPLLNKVKEKFINSKILIKACKFHNKDTALWLTSTMNINPYIQDENGETVLVYCVKYGKNLKAIPYLLKHKEINVNIPDNEGKTVAMYLTEKGDYYNLLNLRKNNCNYDYINDNHQSVLSILMKKMYGSEKERHTIPLKSFIRIFSILVSYQINFNIPIDKDKNTAIMVALSLKDFETVELSAKYLKNLDLSVKNIYGESIITLCIKYGYYSILKLFKNNPTFEYDYKDNLHQNTLLMYSVINNCIFMKEILEYNPKIINEINNKGENALILACKINQIEAVKQLLKSESKFESESESKSTTNHYININQQDNLGNTALHYATEIQNLKLIQLLLSRHPNININIKNNKGKTVKDLANESNNINIIKLINNPKLFIDNELKSNEGIDYYSKNFIHYSKEIQEYIKPKFNNEYPNFILTKKIEKIESTVYNRYTITQSPYVLRIKRIII